MPALCLVVAACAGKPAPLLPSLSIDPQRVAVTGMSSGAYMATQVHLAYSDRLTGAALVAGGPYGCAGGSLDEALGPCMTAAPAPPDVANLASKVRERAAKGELAPLSGLAGDRVWVLHGRKDLLVEERVSRGAASLYQLLAADPQAAALSVEWDGGRDFGHTWPTPASGGDCATTAPPYLGHCGIDAAGEAMQAMFGTVEGAGPGDGTLHRFDQDAYLPEGEDAYVDNDGFLYVPKACADGTRCGLLVAFHGCQQNAAQVGEAFVRDAGFNRWADALGVVVLYPQTRSSYLPLNPKACWDWWGYSGANYDTRDGVQLRWLAQVGAALGVPLR